MLIPIIATVGIAAGTAWLGYLTVRYILPRVPNPATVIVASRQAARDRVLRDPLDHIRAWVARIAPSRMKVEQRMEAAQTIVGQAIAREDHVLTTFKDGKEPSFGFKMTAVTLFVAWIVAVTAVFIIDVPIVSSVSGGNVLFAVVGTVLLIAVPVIFSVLLGHFFARWRQGEIHPALFSAALIGIVAVVTGIVWYLTTLAPMRAEVEYADEIRTVEQQLAMYREDGDQNAVDFAQQNLHDLKAQQERSAEWNTVLVPIAASAEFATGFFFPLAIPLLLLADVRSSRRKAEGALTTARNRVNDQRARQYARISREFQRLGITQLELQLHLAAVAAENRVEQAGIEAARNMVARELQAQVPTPAPAEPHVAAAAPTDQAVTAEIVTTDEIPVVATTPHRDRSQTVERNVTTRQAPAPVAVLDPDDDRSDSILDLD